MEDFVNRSPQTASANTPGLWILVDQEAWSIAGPWHFDEENAPAIERVDFSQLTLNFNYRIQIEGQLYLIHPEDYLYVTALITNLSKTRSIDYHFRVIGGDGSIKIVHGFGKAAEIDAFQIHSSTKAWKQLELKQELLQKCLDGMPHLVWLSDADGNFLLFNDRWHAYTGLTLEGSACYQYVKCGLIHPSQVREVTSKWNYARRYGMPYNNETLLRNADGDYRWHLDTILPLKNDANEVEFWVGTLIDVNDEFLAEKKIQENNHLLEAIFNSSLNGIQVLESVRNEDSNKIVDFEWKYHNRIASEIFSTEDLTDQRLSQVYPAAVKSGMMERFKEVTLKGEPVRFEHYFRSGKTERWFEVSALKLEDGVVATFQDKTERMSAEFDASDSKHFLQQIANSTPDIIYVNDLDEGRIVWVNGKVKDYVGLTPEEVYEGGSAIFQRLVHPDDLDRWIAQTRALCELQGNDTLEIQLRVKAASGTWRWFKVRDTVFKRHTDGSVWQTVGLVQDIQDLKTAQDKINLHHSIDRQAQKISQMGNWQWNLATDEIVWSDNLYELFGLDPATTQPSIKAFIEALHPDDREHFRGEMQKLNTAEPGSLGMFDFRVQLPDGRVRRLRAASELLEVDGEMRFIGTVRDITQELQHERETRERMSFIDALLESSINRVAVVDRELRYLLWNKQCEEEYGMPRSEVLGHTIYEAFPAVRQHPIWLDRFRRAFEGELLHFPEEESLKPGRFDEGFFVPLRNDANEVYAVLTILHDITDRVHAKNELQLLNESLRQKNFELLTVNEQLSTFAFVASHDLREPLRKIQVFTNSILESEQERLSPRGREYFDRILTSIGRMSSMIDDILNFSKINAEAKSFHHIDLNELLNEVVGDLQEAIREQGAQINISRLPDYTGNRSQLHQLFQNLIGNAIKFRHPDRASVVSVTGKVVSGKDIGHPAANSQKNYLQIQVSDNGIGFEEQYYNKIFQMFQRLHSVSQYSGTGMGLAICKKVVENHDGLITVHSTPGEGSEFTCHLLISDS